MIHLHAKYQKYNQQTTNRMAIEGEEAIIMVEEEDMDAVAEAISKITMMLIQVEVEEVAVVEGAEEVMVTTTQMISLLEEDIQGTIGIT
jgi:hypothetical protein